MLSVALSIVARCQLCAFFCAAPKTGVLGADVRPRQTPSLLCYSRALSAAGTGKRTSDGVRVVVRELGGRQQCVVPVEDHLQNPWAVGGRRRRRGDRHRVHRGGAAAKGVLGAGQLRAHSPPDHKTQPNILHALGSETRACGGHGTDPRCPCSCLWPGVPEWPVSRRWGRGGGRHGRARAARRGEDGGRTGWTFHLLA